MVGGDEELDDGLGEEGGERGTYIESLVLGASASLAVSGLLTLKTK